MSSELIFITGATGLVGSTTAHDALKAGHRVRLAIRKEAQIEKIKGVFSEYADRLEFVIVPDITRLDAYEGKLNDVDYILHHASPLVSGTTDKEAYFPPAKNGTLAILNEANRTPSVRKIVITASILSLVPLAGVPKGGVVKEENDWDFSIDENGDFSKASPFDLYHAEKLLADQVTRDFARDNNPHFEIVTIHPGFIYGHNVMQLTAEELSGTNGMLFNSIMNNVPISLAVSVHVQDVAAAHLRALAPDVKHGSKYLLVGPKYTWADVVDVLKKDYANVPWKLDPNTPTGRWETDTSVAEKELGIKWKTVEDQVRSVMDQQLSLRSASA